MWLMQALGFLLSALQVEEILKNLHSLITPYIQQLEKLADETVSAHMLPPSRSGFSYWLLPCGCCVAAALLNVGSRESAVQGTPFWHFASAVLVPQDPKGMTVIEQRSLCHALALFSLAAQSLQQAGHHPHPGPALQPLHHPRHQPPR